MADAGYLTSSEPPSGAATPRSDGKRELKILMLHGYTQSGPLLHAKTRALEKSLHKALLPAPSNLSTRLIYPTGPSPLRPQDLPGYVPPTSANPSSASAVPDDAADSAANSPTADAWAWWRKDEATGAYRYFEAGMLRIAEAIREVGGVDGVVGFSQGASCAAILAALLEHDPATSQPRQPPAKSDSGVYDFESFLPALREANGGKPLKFAVAYSGFFAPVREFAWMYEPPIATPTMHFIGSLDTVVDEGRSRGLVERCVDPVVVVHPGGHYVPVSKEWVAPLVGFVRSHAGEDGVASQL